MIKNFVTMKSNKFILFFLLAGYLMLSTCSKLEKEMSVSTGEVTSVFANSAEASGLIIDLGYGATQHGHCYSKTTNVTVINSKNQLGVPVDTGVFTSQLTNLEAGTKYYIKAYLSNGNQTVYGDERSFFTASALVPTLTTTAITSVTKTTASSGGNISSDGGAPVTACGVCWNTSSGPTTSDSITTDEPGTGSYASSLINLTPGTTYYVKAYAINSAGTAYGNEQSFETKSEIAGTVSDIEGNVYNTIAIGTQIWMKENLKTTTYNDETYIPNVTDNTIWAGLSSGAYCWYNNNAGTYKNIYGALYNWYAVNTEKLCPSGWHVPTDPEWQTLENYLIDNGYNYDGTITQNKIAKALAATTNWVLSEISGSVGNTDYPAFRNKSGFTALPGGNREGNGTFSFFSYAGNWWSSTEYATSNAQMRNIGYEQVYLLRYIYDKTYGFSVRCVKDY